MKVKTYHDLFQAKKNSDVEWMHFFGPKTVTREKRLKIQQCWVHQQQMGGRDRLVGSLHNGKIIKCHDYA